MIILAAKVANSVGTASSLLGHLSIVTAILMLAAVGYYTAKANKGKAIVADEDKTDGSVPVCDEFWAQSRELGKLVDEFDQDGVHVQVYSMWVQIDGMITYHRAFCFLPGYPEPFLVFNLDGTMGCFFFSVHNHRRRIVHSQVHSDVSIKQWQRWAMMMLPLYYKRTTD